MKLYFAQRGTGDMGAAVTRADGMLLPREQTLRARDYCSLFGKFKVARTCYRTPGEPGIFPLDAQVNFPERCYSYFLQEWMTLFEVEHPFKESAGLFEQLFDLEVAESVLMEVAKEAPQDYEAFYAQRPLSPADPEGELLVVSFDGKGVPMIKEEAAKLTAKLGTGEKRQRKKEALVGVSYLVDPKPRTPEALAELLVDPEAARTRQQRAGTTDDAPRAQQVRRVASLVRTKQAVMELIKADAERRDPQHRKPLVVLLDGALGLWNLATKLFKPWKRVTFVLDILHVVGYLWSAANALFGEASKAGQHWVQQKLTAILRGQVGYVIGGLRQILTKQRLRTVGAADARESHHVLPQPSALDAVRRSTWRRACPWGPASWSRRVVRWSSTGWRAKASGGASQGQRPCWRCARLRRATTMISVPTGGSVPVR